MIPRGIKFSVEVEGPCRGWVCEIYKGGFEIPDLGKSFKKLIYL